MKFTYEISPVELAFLDIKIRIDDLRQLQTDIYRKPTSTNSFLHWQSWHPPALKSGIPTGQYLRARRNCSSEEEFKKECDNLYQRFRERGYPKKTLRKAFLRAKATPRNVLLENKPPPPPDNIIRCIGTYDARAQEIQMILRKHWSILKADHNRHYHPTLTSHTDVVKTYEKS